MKKFRVLEKLSTADAAFEIYGRTLEELFANAAEALFSVMVDLTKVEPLQKRTFTLKSRGVEELLFDFLSELIFLKDIKRMVFSRFEVGIKTLDAERLTLNANIFGEKIDPRKHRLGVDVKGVTMHEFKVRKVKDRFRAQAVLDI